VADKGFWDSYLGFAAMLGIAVVIFVGLMGSLTLYAGMWPPLSVVESNSMQHDDERSNLGVIDTGDLVLVQKSDGDDIICYVEGSSIGHKTFGDHGDVIIYRPLGSDERKPIIHRAVLFLEPVGESQWRADALANHPPAKWSVANGDHDSMSGVLKLKEYGHASIDLELDLDRLERSSGFITHGDNNHQDGVGFVDQVQGGPSDGTLVQMQWVVSKPVTEIPWIGSISLFVRGVNFEQVPFNSVMYTIGVLVAVVALPFGAEYGIRRLRGR